MGCRGELIHVPAGLCHQIRLCQTIHAGAGPSLLIRTAMGLFVAFGTKSDEVWFRVLSLPSARLEVVHL